MIMRLNKDLQRKFVKVKRGEIFGQVVVLSQAVEKENLSFVRRSTTDEN